MSARIAWSVLGNSQKLDGGSMFGNAPKALWTRWAAADEHNRIDLACRCLLLRVSPSLRVLTSVRSDFSSRGGYLLAVTAANQTADGQAGKELAVRGVSVISPTWEAEAELHARLVREAKVFLAPGSSSRAPEPGYFRLTYSMARDDSLVEAGRRLRAFVEREQARK